MSFKYDENKYIKAENELIKESIEIDKSGKLFEILTRLKHNGAPSYTYSDMVYLVEIYKETNSIERVERAAQLNSDDTPVYDTAQMFHIVLGYKHHLSYDCIDLYVKLNKNNKPVFNHKRMDSILQGFTSGLSKEDVGLYTKLNKNGAPVYDEDEMDIIRNGLICKLSVENIELYAQLDENMVPVYDSDRMYYIKRFICSANDKQIQQLKDAIADGLSFEQFRAFTKPDIPAEKMRIYRSLYQLDCSIPTVEHIILHEKLTYDELKQVKYILSCAKKFRELLNDEYSDTFTAHNVVYDKFCKLDELYKDFTSRVCEAFASPITHDSIKNVVMELLKKNMDPEQIHFLISSGYSDKEIRIISESLMNGADFNKLKELHKEAKDVLENEEMSKLLETVLDDEELEL